MLYRKRFEMPSYFHDLLGYRLNSGLTGLPFLSELDIDENFPNTIHSRYFNVSKLAPLDSNNIQLSILHTNIPSLNRHSDELVQFCVDARNLLIL